MKMMKSTMTVALVLCFVGMAIGAEPPMKNPVLDAKPGEWCSYRMQQGLEQKMTVKAIDDKSVTVTIEISMGGRNMPAQTVTTSLKEAQDEYDPEKHPEVKFGEKTLTIKGRKIKCITATMKGKDGKPVTSYLSADVPVYGIVKLEQDGQEVMVLTDWGTK